MVLQDLVKGDEIIINKEVRAKMADWKAAKIAK